MGRETKEVKCKICGNKFITTYPNKMFCSWDCKTEARRARTRIANLKRKYK